MYTIKKFQLGEVIKSAGTVQVKSRGITWVAMLNNGPVLRPNLFTRKNELAAYSHRVSAQEEANRLNRRAFNVEYWGDDFVADANQVEWMALEDFIKEYNELTQSNV